MATTTWISLALAFTGATPMSNSERTINVNGNAEVKVAPDEVILTLGVESLDKDLQRAKKENDDRVKKVLAAAKGDGVADKDLATDEVQIEPRYDSSSSYSSEAKLKAYGYSVRKTVVITLREVPHFEKLLTDCLEAGANYVHGIDFQTTALRKHRDAARSLAIKAAKEKAEALAKVLSCKVGAPRTITEMSGGSYPSYGRWWGGRGGMMSQNVVQSAGGPSEPTEGAFAPGTISVTANVSVVFDLE
jgi:uncharacterized protein